MTIEELQEFINSWSSRLETIDSFPNGYIVLPVESGEEAEILIEQIRQLGFAAYVRKSVLGIEVAITDKLSFATK